MMISRIGNRFSGARSGFTLIEVLMAVSILAIGIVGVLRAYSSSINAMEIAQYNVDASCLLKAVMGETEEARIAEKGTSVGVSSGEIGSSGGIKIDTTRSGVWQWNKDISDTGLQVKAPDEAVEGEEKQGEGEGGAQGEQKEEQKEDGKQAAYSLNEVKVTVVNPGRNPSRKIGLVTYMESKSAES